MSFPTEPDGPPAVDRPVLRVILDSPRPVWILVCGVLLNRAGSYFATFLTLFLQQLGFSLRQMPLILLVVGLAIPCGSMLGGWASDRFSRKMSMVGTTLLAAAGLALIGLAPNREAALVGVFVAALFAQSYLPAASALLVDHTAKRDRVPVFAFFRLALNVGAAIGSLLAVVLAPHGLDLLFLVDALTYLIFSVVLLVGLPDSRRAADPSVTANGDGGSAPTTRAVHLRLLAVLGGVLGVTMVYVQYSSTVPLAVARYHDAAAYAGLLTLNAVLVILVEVPLSSWTRKLPWRVPLVLGTGCMAGGIVVCGAVRPFPVVVAGVVGWTIGEILFSPVVASAVAALASADRIGIYQGYLATVQAAAFALGPAAGTFGYGANPALLWILCLAVGALAAASFWFAGSDIRARKT